MRSEGNLSFSLILTALMQINFATPARHTAKAGGENTDAQRNQKKIKCFCVFSGDKIQLT